MECTDLGVLNRLKINDLKSYKRSFFFYSNDNQHIYAYISKEALEKDFDKDIPGKTLTIDQIQQAILQSIAPLTHQEKEETLEDSSGSLSKIFEQLTTIASPSTSPEQTRRSEPIPSEQQIKNALNDVTYFKRSRTGTDGVYFMDGEQEETARLVLKIYSENDRAVKEVVADKFFQKLGFITPRYQVFETGSEIWNLAYKKLSAHHQSSNKKDTQLGRNLESKYNITVMERIPGKPFTELPKDKLVNIFKNKEVLQALGEMVFLDNFIGNTDRLDLDGCNPDNFFFSEKKQNIALLDHGYGLENPIFIRRTQKKIDNSFETSLKNSLQQRMIGLIVALFKSNEDSTQGLNDEQRKENAMEFLEESALNYDLMVDGVYSAAERLVDQFHIKEEGQEQGKVGAIKTIFEAYPNDIQDKQVNQFIQLVSYVAKQLEKQKE